MEAQTPGQRMANYRAKMRAQGLRPVQAWIPDTRDSAFQQEAWRQSRILVGDAHEDAILDRIERADDVDEWRP